MVTSAPDLDFIRKKKEEEAARLKHDIKPEPLPAIVERSIKKESTAPPVPTTVLNPFNLWLVNILPILIQCNLMKYLFYLPRFQHFFSCKICWPALLNASIITFISISILVF